MQKHNEFDGIKQAVPLKYSFGGCDASITLTGRQGMIYGLCLGFIIMCIFLMAVFSNASIEAAENEAAQVPDQLRIEAVIGDGETGFRDGAFYWSRFFFPRGVATGENDTLIVADSQNQRLREITLGGEDDQGEVNTLAGTSPGKDPYDFPIGGYTDGALEEVRFNEPRDVVYFNGELYISDAENHAIRILALEEENVRTLAGSGEAGQADGRGTEAAFDTPSGLDIDEAGNVYVADTLNHALRKITPEGDVTTFPLAFNEPYDVVVTQGDQGDQGDQGEEAQDARLYLTDSGHQRIWEIDLTAWDRLSELEENLERAQIEDSLDLALHKEADEATAVDEALNLLAGSGDTKLAETDYIDGGYTDGALNDATFNFPKGLAYLDGYILVADAWNQAIRAICLESDYVTTLFSREMEGPMDVVSTGQDTLALVDMWLNQVFVLGLDDGTLQAFISAQIAAEKERAERPEVEQVILQPGERTVSHYVDEAHRETRELDVAPLIEEQRTLIPIRDVIDHYDARLTWDGDARQVLVERADIQVMLTIGSDLARVHDREVEMDVAPKIKEERSLIPLRFVSEQLGYEVEWREEERKVLIEYHP